MKTVTIKSFGADALLIDFEQKIDVGIAEEVSQLSNYLKQQKGVLAVIPAYSSITVAFDLIATSFEQLQHAVHSYDLDDATAIGKNSIITIPVCYESTFGLDLESLAQTLNLSADELIKLHTDTLYHTYMIGFLPGFPYLGKTVDKLYCERLQKPRKQVKAGSVGLAGNQTGIYPLAAPGGWQIIGSTPLPIFQPNEANEFLFETGDKVRFKAIDKDHYWAIEDQLQQKTFNWEEIYE